jgi:hypothetical protein
MLPRGNAVVIAHYHSERNRQGLGNVIPFPSGITSPDGRIGHRERLGGLSASTNEKPRKNPRIVRRYGARAQRTPATFPLELAGESERLDDSRLNFPSPNEPPKSS